jgi:hypothetical protein
MGAQMTSRYAFLEKLFKDRGFDSLVDAYELMGKFSPVHPKAWDAYLKWYDSDGTKSDLLEIIDKTLPKNLTTV